MKQFKLTFLLLVLMSMVSNKASAYDFSVENDDGVTIYYNTSGSNGAYVTYRNGDYNSYSGVVRIPSTVSYAGGTRTVTSIGSDAFYGCSSLTSIEIPSSVTSIGNYAFQYCSSLTYIEIPSSVTSIGWSAFSGCSSLTSIEIPNSVTSIGDNAFYDTPWYNNKPDGLVYAGKVAYKYKGAMPSNTSIVLEEGTKGIGEWAFNKCSGLTSIEIPNSVTSIGADAFADCSGLISIEIPNSVTSIGTLAFSGCEKIQSVSIPESVTDMETNPFAFCDGIKNLFVSQWNERYYSWMNGIIDKSTQTLIMASKNTSIPSDVKIIGQDAFCFSNVSAPDPKYREVDRSIILPEGVEELTSWAIRNVHIGTLHIPSTIKRVSRGGNDHFFMRSIIDVLELADIKAWCEAEVPLDGLTGADLRDTEILELYHDGVEIKDLVIPDNTNKIGDYCFAIIKGITSVKIPSSVTSIGEGAFYECSGLTSVEIPSGVTSIGPVSFYGCSGLTSIEIPSSVTSIGSRAFEDCTSLTSVTVEWETPITITSGVFSNRANATLYVPRGCKAAYEAAFYWKDFKEIVEYDANVEITMGSSGITTYSSNYNLDFTSVSGLKAYIASGFSPSTGELAMLRIYKVPAGEGVLLKGEPGSYEVPGLKSDYIYANMLVGVSKATTVEPTDGEYTNFILANDEVKGIGFYPLASAGEIGPNKAYLQVLSSAFAAARSLRMVFEDEEDVTGVNALNDKLKMINHCCPLKIAKRSLK